MGEGAQFGGFGWGEMAFAVPIPEFQPRREVLWFEAESEVFHRHLPGVIRWAAGGAGPEFGDFGNVFGPVVNLCVEDRADDLMLADIGIELPEERPELFHAADSFE